MRYFTGFPMHFISFRLIFVAFNGNRNQMSAQSTNNYSCVQCISTNCKPERERVEKIQLNFKYSTLSLSPLLGSLIQCDNLIAKPQNCGRTANAQSKVHYTTLQCLLTHTPHLPICPVNTCTKKISPLEHLLHKVHAIFMLCKLIKYQMGKTHNENQYRRRL